MTILHSDYVSNSTVMILHETIIVSQVNTALKKLHLAAMFPNLEKLYMFSRDQQPEISTSSMASEMLSREQT